MAGKVDSQVRAAGKALATPRLRANMRALVLVQPLMPPTVSVLSDRKAKESAIALPGVCLCVLSALFVFFRLHA